MEQQKKGLSIASLACGVVGLILSFCLGWVGGILAIVGLVLGIVAMNKEGRNGMNIAGVITGAIGIIAAAFTGAVLDSLKYY